MIVGLDAIDPVESYALCVVGSGPIGMALTLAAAAKGLKVLVLEAGGEKAGSDSQLGDAELVDPNAHELLRDANCHALGGTSHWWGGRCVPFDPIDFVPRAWIPLSDWPISYEHVAPYYAATADYFGIAGPAFSRPGPWTNLNGLRVDQLERWAPNPNMASLHGNALMASLRIHVVLGATVTGLDLSANGRRVSGLALTQGSKQRKLAVARVVLACGGTQTPRLLLIAQRSRPTLFGGHDGPLGRYYMGHSFGKIADLVLNDPRLAAAFDYFLDAHVYARRRITFPSEVQLQHRLLQTSYGLSNARIADPSHRSGALSLIWLALASPLGKRMLPEALLKIYIGTGKRRWAAHVGNVVCTAVPTLVNAFRIYRDKYVRRPGKPAVILFSSSGRYAIHYHAEQTPNADNRLTLDDSVDAYGMSRLRIAFRYTLADARTIVRGHRLLDAALRANGIGRLEFGVDDDDALAADVLAQARDGMHQIGAARMSANPATGVVDSDCRVHGVDNLYLASSCVFPTSGHANPTFLGVALALRLAQHLVDTTERQVAHPAVNAAR